MSYNNDIFILCLKEAISLLRDEQNYSNLNERCKVARLLHYCQSLIISNFSNIKISFIQRKNSGEKLHCENRALFVDVEYKFTNVFEQCNNRTCGKSDCINFGMAIQNDNFNDLLIHNRDNKLFFAVEAKPNTFSNLANKDNYKRLIYYTCPHSNVDIPLTCFIGMASHIDLCIFRNRELISHQNYFKDINSKRIWVESPLELSRHELMRILG